MKRAWMLGAVAMTAAGCKNEGSVNLLRQPPTAEITAPTDGEILLGDGRTVALEGIVTDLPDALETLGIVWSIDAAPITSFPANPDGEVAAAWSLEGVPFGEHTIELTVSDSDGNVQIARIDVEVVAPSSPPLVEITAPDDGSTFELGESITFTGQATDANDDGDDLVFTWTSSFDGLIEGASSGGGLTFVSTDELSDGEHTIVLSATDTDGDVGTDSIVVIVGTPDDPPVDDPEPGELIFSELMIKPELVDDEVGEWVELYNTGGKWLDIGGYSFHDKDMDTYTLTGSIPVAPHGYVVLCADLNPSVNGGVDCDAFFKRDSSGAGLALANGPDEVILTRPDGVDIDRLDYSNPWVQDDTAVALDPQHMTPEDNDDFANWCFQTSTIPSGAAGTPGEENDPCP